MSNASDLLIIGGGLASISVIRELRDAGDKRSITVLTDEKTPPYDRPPLSKQFLLAQMDEEEIGIFRDGEMASLDVLWKQQYRAVSLDPDELCIGGVDDGRAEAFTWSAKDIVIACGARPRVPLGLGGEVLTLRTLVDARRLRGRFSEGAKVLIIGAGFIGLELASSAHEMGCDVTVVEAASAPLSRVLHDRVGSWFVDFHRRNGVDIRCGRMVQRLSRQGTQSMVEFDDGLIQTFDTVVAGVGVQPVTDWLEGSGIDLDNGIVCDGRGETSRPHVWALGDVANWPHPMTGARERVEQWQAAVDQGRTVAQALMGKSAEWSSIPYFWSDQHGSKIQFAGRSSKDVELTNPAEDRLAVIFCEGDVGVGIFTVDQPRKLALGRRLLAQGGDLRRLRQLLT